MNRIFYGMVLIAFLTATWSQLRYEPLPKVEVVEVDADGDGVTSKRDCNDADPAIRPGGEEVPRNKKDDDCDATTPDEPVAPMVKLTDGALEAAKSAVTLSLGLVGGMALFLGLMKIVEVGGGLVFVAKLVRPLMVRLFPDVPPDHPAMGAMIMNMAANALGLGNAATPFGIRAMKELDRLNGEKGTATNAMALFLAINTSSVTILPTGVMVIRDQLGSNDPAGILGTTLFATMCSTGTAILAIKLLQRTSPNPPVANDAAATDAPAIEVAGEFPLWASVLALGSIVAIVPLSIAYGEAMSPWIVPALMIGFLTFGVVRGVPVYETFVKGAKEGFDIAVMIIPYLIAVLSAIGMLRASGALEAFTSTVGPFTEKIGLPAEALPMALLRPLSGSGANGVMMDTMRTYGPDSYVGYLVSTIQGSTETTFYVLAVYFGAIGVKKYRHTLGAALLADTAGILGSVAICWYLYGHLA